MVANTFTLMEMLGGIIVGLVSGFFIGRDTNFVKQKKESKGIDKQEEYTK